MSDTPSLTPRDAEFLKTEYQEAAKAYALGVQVGQAIMGSYLVGTGVLATIFAVTIGQLKEYPGIARLAVLIIPIVGIVGSIVILAMTFGYENHLENCRKRCAKLEEQFGGKLFTEIGQTPVNIDAVHALRIICGLFLALWVAVLVISLLWAVG
jgi:preprotein translocase subunit Sss1